MTGNDNNHHNEEHKAVEETSENVEFFDSELSAVNKVEDLHENESIEQNAVKLSFVGWVGVVIIVLVVDGVVQIPHEFSEIHKNNNCENLIDCNSKDLSPHNWGHNIIFRAGWSSFGQDG